MIEEDSCKELKHLIRSPWQVDILASVTRKFNVTTSGKSLIPGSEYVVVFEAPSMSNLIGSLEDSSPDRGTFILVVHWAKRSRVRALETNPAVRG